MGGQVKYEKKNKKEKDPFEMEYKEIFLDFMRHGFFFHPNFSEDFPKRMPKIPEEA